MTSSPDEILYPVLSVWLTFLWSFFPGLSVTNEFQSVVEL